MVSPYGAYLELYSTAHLKLLMGKIRLILSCSPDLWLSCNVAKNFNQVLFVRMVLLIAEHILRG
mgnify:CR=1 FL=1